MEHPCYKCGQNLDDGVPFCPNCGAPQIRVSTVIENEPATPLLEPGTPGEVQPPAEPAHFEQQGWSRPQPPTETGIHWADALPGAMMAGLLVMIAWILPRLGFFLWPIIAGGIAVFLYGRRRPEAVPAPKSAAKIGAVAGLFGFILYAALMAFVLVATGAGQLRQAMGQVLQQAASRNPGPETEAMMKRLMSPEGMATMITIVLIIFMLLFVGLGSLGGALGSKLLKRKDHADLG